MHCACVGSVCVGLACVASACVGIVVCCLHPWSYAAYNLQCITNVVGDNMMQILHPKTPQNHPNETKFNRVDVISPKKLFLKFHQNRMKNDGAILLTSKTYETRGFSAKTGLKNKISKNPYSHLEFVT